MTFTSRTSWNRRTFMAAAGQLAASAFAAAAMPAWLRPASIGGPLPLERTVVAMGTTVSITAYGHDRAALFQATNDAFKELYRLDRLLSVFRPESDISRLNKADADEPVQIDRVTLEALAASGHFTELTNGAFDATVGAVLARWGFHADAGSSLAPREADVTDAIEGLGWRHVRVASDGSARRLHPATQVDLGGIGVGFTVDRMGAVLRRHGVTSALIDHSGDLLAIGRPPDTEAWMVGIPDPVDDDRILLQLPLRDQALSTSSNVRTTRLVHGRTVGHIVDPRTGDNPDRVLGVSVLAPSSTEADALSTALFVDADLTGKWRNGRREAILVRRDGQDRTFDRVR